MKYPIEKYNIVVHQHPVYNTTEVIAISTYAGKAVKGKAICHIDDTYSEESGVKLAVARCADRIAAKRIKRAERKLKEAGDQLIAATKHYNDMRKYLHDAQNEKEVCELELHDIYHNLG